MQPVTRWILIPLFLLLAACQTAVTPSQPPKQSLPKTETPNATPSAPTAIPSTPSLTPPTLVILPHNAVEVVQRERFGRGTIQTAPVVSPDSRTLAVASSIGVDLYDLLTSQLIQSLQTGGSGNRPVFSPDSQFLATGTPHSADIQLWDVTTGRPARQLSAGLESNAYLNELAYSPDGRLVAAGYGPEATTLVWRAADGELLLNLKGDRLAFSPDARLLLASEETPDQPGRRVFYLYDLNGGTLLNQWEGQQAVFSPSGLLTLEQDGAVRVMDLAANKVLQAFNGKNAAFSPDGAILALFANGAVKQYSVPDGRVLRTLEGDYEDVFDLRFASDGQTLAGSTLIPMCPGCLAEGGPVALWRIADGTLIQEIGQNTPWFAFTSDGQNLVVSSDQRIDIYHTADGTPITTLEGYTPMVAGLAFSPDGETLAAASGGDSLTVSLWRISDGQVVQLLEDTGSGSDWTELDVAFSPEGQNLAVRGDFWDPSSGERLTDLEQNLQALAPPYWASSVAFSPDRETLATGYLDGQILLWDVNTGRPQRKLQGFSGDVAGLAFSPDGRILAALYTYPDFTVQFWQVADGKRLNALSGSYFTRMALSPDGQHLATISVKEEYEAFGSPGFVQMWRIADGEKLLELDINDATSLTFSPDGQILATGSTDGSVRLWQVTSGEMLADLPGHTGLVADLVFAPDGEQLASASHDGTLILWGIQSP